MAKKVINYLFVLNIILCLIQVSSYSVDKTCNNGTSSVKLEKSSSGRRHLHEKCCPGYRQELSNESTLNSIKCVPICIPTCKNGACQTPGVCACDTGFKSDPAQENHCIPYCSDGCHHGTCVNPEQCICDYGYQYDLDEERCQPVCTEPCHNGTCVLPENCECFPGYRKSETNDCQPYCSVGCHNGHCIRPDYCACDSGWSHFNRHFVFYPGECFEIAVESTTEGQIVISLNWSNDAITSTKTWDGVNDKNDKMKTDSDDTNVFIIIGSVLFIACLIFFAVLVLKWTNLLDYMLGKSYVIEDKGISDLNME